MSAPGDISTRTTPTQYAPLILISYPTVCRSVANASMAGRGPSSVVGNGAVCTGRPSQIAPAILMISCTTRPWAPDSRSATRSIVDAPSSALGIRRRRGNISAQRARAVPRTGTSAIAATCESRSTLISSVSRDRMDRARGSPVQ